MSATKEQRLVYISQGGRSTNVQLHVYYSTISLISLAASYQLSTHKPEWQSWREQLVMNIFCTITWLWKSHKHVTEVEESLGQKKRWDLGVQYIAMTIINNDYNSKKLACKCWFAVIVLDAPLTWNAHADYLIGKVGKWLGILSQIRQKCKYLHSKYRFIYVLRSPYSWLLWYWHLELLQEC